MSCDAKVSEEIVNLGDEDPSGWQGEKIGINGDDKVKARIRLGYSGFFFLISW